MSGVWRAFLDDAPGERRGVVTRDGQPERLLIERDTDAASHRTGARLIARVRRIDKTLATAFLDLGTAPDGLLPLSGAQGLTEGARIEIEIVAPPRRDKGPVTRLIGPGEGAPRLLAAGTDMSAHLKSVVSDVPIETGPVARGAADAAEEAALAVVHPLTGGGWISIEPTRALIAIDVDLGSAKGDSRRAAGGANRAAIQAAARLLRLKGLGGPVVIDLVGKGHDGGMLSKIASEAFAPDQPGVAIGPISRFGLMELVTPRRHAPIAEMLIDDTGAPTLQTLALRLVRQIEATAGPGQMIEGACAPDVAEIARGLEPALAGRIGPRFVIRSDPACPRAILRVRPVERLS